MYVEWATVVESNPNASLSIATTPRCKESATFFLCWSTLSLIRTLQCCVKQVGIKGYFWVLVITWFGIEPRFPGPLVNTLRTFFFSCLFCVCGVLLLFKGCKWRILRPLTRSVLGEAKCVYFYLINTELELFKMFWYRIRII